MTAATRGERSVTVLASHHESGPSMRRYGELLAEAYRSAGWRVRVLKPRTWVSDRIGEDSVMRKGVVYLEKLILFPLTLPVLTRHDALVHVSDHSDAPWLRFVSRRAERLITCHDLIAIHAAEGRLDAHRPRWTGRLYQRLISDSLRGASAIAAVSEATLKDVRTAYPATPSRLLHNPLSPAVSSAAVGLVDETATPYLLVVSSSSWRKRRPLAVEAWQRLRAAVEPGLRLVVVGDPFTPEERAVIGGSPEEMPDVIVRSGLTDDELAHLYAGASALLQLSGQEGFGWPIVEANHWGTAAICSELPVFREVGPHNVFVPDDMAVVDWTATWSAVRDPDRATAVQEDARRFSPDAFAEQLNTIALDLVDTEHGARRTSRHS